MLLSLAITIAQACSCIGYEPLDKAVTRSESVFAGTVVKSVSDAVVLAALQIPLIGRLFVNRAVSFDVREVFKGQPGKQETVLVEMQQCSYLMGPGEDFLVFAVRSSQDGKLHAYMPCGGRTGPLMRADNDVAELRAKKR